MAKKRVLTGLQSLKAIERIKADPEKRASTTIAGMDASEAALKQDEAKKTKQVGMRLGGKDLEIVEMLAIKLKKCGLQYSEANAVRLALRLFEGSDLDVQRIAAQIKEEDGRKRRRS